LNLILTGLTTVEATPITLDSTTTASEWNTSETCQLNIRTILDNFDIDKQLWNENEKKIGELFTLISE
jgi:hypothetical protein